MRRWLWPYALLAVILTTVAFSLGATLLGGRGVAGIGARIAVADAVVIEPAKAALVSLLDFLAPFAVPLWLKSLYANLVVIAVICMVVAMTAGVVLLPIFYAVYRGARPE